MNPSPGHGQLALNLRLRDASSFENFISAANREAVEHVRNAALEAGQCSLPARSIYLWGESGSGKTHLLEAACRLAQGNGATSLYVPLREMQSLSPALIEDLDQTSLVCIDDLDRMAGDSEWERGLFALYENLKARGGTLVMGAGTNPGELGFVLPDLVTRLAAGLVYPLRTATEEEKIAALRLRAGQRGMEMGEEVVRYLLARFPRDMHSLFGLLDRLDDATLAAQRRLTIPFLRDLTP